METSKSNKQIFGVFQLVMIAIVSVDSLRNIPIGAQYGLSLVFFYLIAGIAFFFPLAWTASQLAVRFPNAGGSYLWVEAAFGKTFGYLSLWLLWTFNVIWYPTIFAFISNIIASMLFPQLQSNKWYIFITCAGLFWLITYLHSFGVRTSGRISTLCALVGTLLPMVLMIGLAIYWLASGSPSATPITVQALLPTAEAASNLGYFSNILFSLLGIEVIAMYSANVTKPKSSYPRALIISAPIILLTLVLSSLALCIIVPPEQIKLLSGIMDIFELFFTTHHLPLGTAVVGFCIVIGGLGIASSWMVSLCRGIHVAISKASPNHKLAILNKNDVPMNILTLQGIIYTFLLSYFLFSPSVLDSYWILSVLTAQFALLYYVLLFSAAIKLFRAESRSKFQTFLGTAVPLTASIMSLIGIAVGFIPPSDVANAFSYEVYVLGSIALFCLIPFFIFRRQAKKNAYA